MFRELFDNISIIQIGIFTAINLIYCVANVIKDVLRQKGTRRQSALMSAISYSIYIVVVKRVAEVSYSTAIIGTILSNLIGDYLGRVIAENLIPRGIVCYRFTVCKDKTGLDKINEYLENNDLGYKWEEAHSLHNDYLSYQIYTKDKNEDKLIENLLIENKIDKYNRSETKNSYNPVFSKKES